MLQPTNRIRKFWALSQRERLEAAYTDHFFAYALQRMGVQDSVELRRLRECAAGMIDRDGKL